MNEYQPIKDGIFSASNIRECNRKVISIQKRLDKAVADCDKKCIRETFNLLTRNSFAVKTLAVWRITIHNQGKYTAGVDGYKIPKEATKAEQDKIRLQLLNEIDIFKKPSLIKRVYIPKPNGKKRPLGIPTLKDRIIQDILRIALDPICEYHFLNCSYGFRPKRSCHDAVQQLFRNLSDTKSKRYVIEGDIEGCFDNINHDHIINTLINWKVPKWATTIIMRMLKSDILTYNGQIYDNDTSTPQGGVISPLLVNVALTSLDIFCSNNYGYNYYPKGEKRRTNPLVRYADDFIITCKSEPEAKQIKTEISEHLSSIGLTLSDEKTKITHITKGFNFLGFNFRKYQLKGKHQSRSKKKIYAQESKWNDYKLLIKPEKEKVINFLRDCQLVISTNKTAKQVSLINLLNPKLRGWAMYYRFVVSKDTFSHIDHHLWWKLYRWSKRRHPNKTKSWIITRYFHKIKNLSGQFLDKEKDVKLFRLKEIPVTRFTKVKNYRVYDKNPETLKYWEQREYTNAYNQIFSVKLRKLYVSQKGKCSFCKEQMTDKQVSNTELHIHHLRPKSQGGSDSYSNLRLLHNECHKELHSIFSELKMAEYINLKIDYLRLLKSEPKS